MAPQRTRASPRRGGPRGPCRFYVITQIEYWRNFFFKRRFPIHKLFKRSCELGL